MPVITYNKRFEAKFTNENGDLIEVWLSQKDFEGDAETLLLDGPGVKIQYLENEDERFGIRASECVISFWLEEGSPELDIDTFIGADNEWKVTIWNHLNLGRPYWEGFLFQEETMRPMQDRPYRFELRASDGLGRLKGKELRRHDGTTKFKGKWRAIDYIGNIIWKLNPGLEIWSHFNVFEESMLNRTDDALADTLFQIKWDARTFIRSTGAEDAVWDDEYTVLEKILIGMGARMFQQHGVWHIVDCEAYLRGLSSFTKYVFDLTDPDAYQLDANDAVLDKSFVAKIAPANEPSFTGTMFPTLEDQLTGLKFANKYVKLTYYYTTQNLPENYTWRRGDYIADVGANKKYTIEDWDHGQITAVTLTSDPVLGATTATAYRLSIYDTFGYETDHHAVLESLSGQRIWLKSEGIPVEVHDKISFTIDVSGNGAGTISNYNAVCVYILTNAGGRISMDNNGNWGGPGLQMLSASFTTNKQDWQTINVESKAIPFGGTLKIALEANDQLMGTEVYFRDLQFDYFPYIAGSHRQTKGDFNKVTQDADVRESAETEVFVSDGVRKVFRGAMFRENGTALATPTWYYGTPPIAPVNQRFGEMQAVKRWRLSRRNMKKIEGSFDSLFFYDTVDTTPQHIGLLNLFQIEHTTAESKNYMLGNFEVDLSTGIWTGVLLETGDASTDVEAAPDTKQYNYFFE